jgi:hypothetical protein
MAGAATNFFDKLCLQDTLPNYNLNLALFTSNTTPTTASVFSDFTLCTATGYADQVLAGGSWTFADETTYSQASYATQTFTFTSGTTIYGYIIYNPSGDVLFGGELFSDGPYSFSSAGGSVVIDPLITVG